MFSAFQEARAMIKIFRTICFACSAIFPLHALATDTPPILVAVNMSFGDISSINKAVVRSILLSKSTQSPAGNRVTLILPENEKERDRIYESFGVDGWQVNSSWSRNAYSAGGKISYFSSLIDAEKMIQHNPGAIAIFLPKSQNQSVLSSNRIIEKELNQ